MEKIAFPASARAKRPAMTINIPTPEIPMPQGAAVPAKPALKPPAQST
jgi:hypothetical protein